MPAIAKKCSPHPIEKPAPIGTPLCSRLAVLEVVKVHYDTGSPRTGKNWPYQRPDDPTWVSIDFRVTNLTPAINFRTKQLVPTLTDVDNKMARASGAYDDKSVPARGSETFRADYVFGAEDNGSLERLVVCNAYLSSPSASQGCGLLTKGG